MSNCTCSNSNEEACRFCKINDDLTEELATALRGLGENVSLLNGDLSFLSILAACGDEFSHLSKNVKGMEKPWLATASKYTEDYALCVEGDTPREAIAKLLCALHGVIVD